MFNTKTICHQGRSADTTESAKDMKTNHKIRQGANRSTSKFVLVCLFLLLSLSSITKVVVYDAPVVAASETTSNSNDKKLSPMIRAAVADICNQLLIVFIR